MYQAKSFTWAIHIYVNGEYYYKPIERNKTRLLDGVVLELQMGDVVGTYKT